MFSKLQLNTLNPWQAGHKDNKKVSSRGNSSRTELMRCLKKRVSIALLLATILTVVVVGIVFAGSTDQPVEWQVNPSSYRWTLTSVGQGWLVTGDRCDSNDYVFKVNKTASTEPDRLRIYSFDSKVQSGFTNTSPMGYNLLETSPYLCLGYRNTRNAGGPMNVQSKLFVWIQ